MSKKKHGDVYRQAAMTVHYTTAGYPSCSAIWHVLGIAPKTLVDVELCTESMRYAQLFRPDVRPDELPHYGSRWGNHWGETDEECKPCRILALLFMAEIADSEGDRKP